MELLVESLEKVCDEGDFDPTVIRNDVLEKVIVHILTYVSGDVDDRFTVAKGLTEGFEFCGTVHIKSRQFAIV